ncbi:DUF1385 domain-containing protein [Polyangium sorediatum]|uniref:DUF1385 domain-containing protein n=1 Tax=Polyangium sorediatum TaxID=889274 RepID=A0ABT6NXG4_9BACT|nr:DUF1385 domain-containing protein [Polyangium sorediatum]MDI1433003.1 DUF1385 domain-containing protein [Polyangium sorediatum]
MSQEVARPYIGGQAVIEGVMMRSPRSLSIVCRRRSGELVVRERAAPTLAQGPRTWPLVRGIVTVVESLKLGSQALRWSADLYEQDLDDDDKPKSKKTPPSASNVLTALSLPILSLVTSSGEAAPSTGSKGAGGFGFISILFAVGLFVAAPQAGAEGINKLLDLGLPIGSPGFQALTGAAKLLIVVGYMLLIRQVAEIRRVFQYHGAEHKAISTYEAHEELTVENAAKKTTLHARCGTTFLVMVALVSILVFSAIGAFLPTIPGGRLAQSVGFFFMKLPFLPFIAAITYELQRFFARFCTVGPLQVLLWPGFLVQKITTAEPEPAQLEVALASLRATLWREAATQGAPAEVPDRVFPDYGRLLADPGYVGARV